MRKEMTSVSVIPGIVTSVTLNKPEVHNAMNDVMIAELTEAFNSFLENTSTRVVVLRGNGKSFCAGADLNYMKSIAGFGFDENVKDGQKLAVLFKAIYDCPIPTIALVHGAVFGGANGLLAACDIVIAEENTTFAFSEVKLGIAPATIAPFVIKRIGEFGAKELMMTGKRFKAPEAQKWNLVNHICPIDELENTSQELVKQLLGSAPQAVKETKQLIKKVISSHQNSDELIEFTTIKIAELRASEEGQEGMASFLEKRKPNWVE